MKIYIRPKTYGIHVIKYYFLKIMKIVGCSNNVRPKKCDVINAQCVSKTFKTLEFFSIYVPLHLGCIYIRDMNILR